MEIREMTFSELEARGAYRIVGRKNHRIYILTAHGNWRESLAPPHPGLQVTLRDMREVRDRMIRDSLYGGGTA